ncbi:MAG: hypothetical protein L6406_13450, partial [Desulfobacterales bacterium]|nr:hypothetical protein [Desulfobacterales bacterium]
KVLDTETAMIIAASSGSIARTAAINELLARGIESSQPVSQQAPPSTSTSYAYGPKTYGVVEDFYFRIVVLNVGKSGNKFANIQLEYQNKTDKEIKLVYGSGWAAILVDDMGNKSQIHNNSLPSSIIPPKAKKSLGLGFEFYGGKKLGDNFNLTILHRSNPQALYLLQT